MFSHLWSLLRISLLEPLVLLSEVFDLLSQLYDLGSERLSLFDGSIGLFHVGLGLLGGDSGGEELSFHFFVVVNEAA